MEKNKYSFDNIVKMIIIVGLIQATCTIMAFISPEIKKFFIDTMSTNIGPDNKISLYVTDISSKRNYGFAYSLYDMFGYTTSVIFVVTLNYVLYVDKTYFLAPFAIFMMPLLNTRTGLYLSILGICISIFIYITHNKNIKAILKTCMLLPALIFFIIAAFNLMKEVSPNTFLWIEDGIASTLDLILRGEVTGGYYTEMASYWFLPEGIGIIFGTGLSPKFSIQRNSDIGYINIIWKYGVFGSLIVLFMYLRMFKAALTSTIDPMKKSIIIFLIMSLLIYMVKLDAIKAAPATYILFILISAIIYDNNKKKI